MNLFGLFANVLTSGILNLFFDPICLPRNYKTGTVCVCNSEYCDKILPLFKLDNIFFYHYESNEKGARLQRDIKWTHTKLKRQSEEVQINSTQESNNTILGWGGTFTDSSGISINSLSKNCREKLMRSYFGEEGLELNMGRVPIGDSDFGTHRYTYDEFSNDTALSKFNLTEEDFNYKIPIIKEASKLLNDSLKLFSSAWSAPDWIKEKNSIGKNKYQIWADYHLKFLDEYKKQGIDFWGITTGYEPVSSAKNRKELNRVQWNPSTMKNWIIDNLVPTIKNSTYSNLKIMTFDDERKYLSWLNKKDFLKDLNGYVDGLVMHSYDKNAEKLLNSIRSANQDYFYISSLVSDFKRPIKLGSWTNAENYAEGLIKDLNNGITGHVDWNLALDLNWGQEVEKFADAPIIVNSTADEFYKQPIYYIIGHFSKFITTGSVLIRVEHKIRNFEITAFKRPDTAIAVIILNKSKNDRQVKISFDTKEVIFCVLKGRSVNSLLFWNK